MNQIKQWKQQLEIYRERPTLNELVAKLEASLKSRGLTNCLQKAKLT